MPVTHRLITVEPTPGRVVMDVSVSWVMPWEVRRKGMTSSFVLPQVTP